MRRKLGKSIRFPLIFLRFKSFLRLNWEVRASTCDWKCFRSHTELFSDFFEKKKVYFCSARAKNEWRTREEKFTLQKIFKGIISEVSGFNDLEFVELKLEDDLIKVWLNEDNNFKTAPKFYAIH